MYLDLLSTIFIADVLSESGLSWADLLSNTATLLGLMFEVLQVFKISIFPVAQLLLIIFKHLMLFVNRFCSCF